MFIAPETTGASLISTALTKQVEYRAPPRKSSSGEMGRQAPAKPLRDRLWHSKDEAGFSGLSVYKIIKYSATVVILLGGVIFGQWKSYLAFKESGLPEAYSILTLTYIMTFLPGLLVIYFVIAPAVSFVITALLHGFLVVAHSVSRLFTPRAGKTGPASSEAVSPEADSPGVAPEDSAKPKGRASSSGRIESRDITTGDFKAAGLGREESTALMESLNWDLGEFRRIAFSRLRAKRSIRYGSNKRDPGKNCARPRRLRRGQGRNSAGHRGP